MYKSKQCWPVIFTHKVFSAFPQPTVVYIQDGGWKWDSRSYVIKHRAEGQDELLLESAALLALEASVYPVRYGAIWEITHLHSSCRVAGSPRDYCHPAISPLLLVCVGLTTCYLSWRNCPVKWKTTSQVTCAAYYDTVMFFFCSVTSGDCRNFKWEQKRKLGDVVCRVTKSMLGRGWLG